MNVGLTRALLSRHSDGSENFHSFKRCPPTNPELVFSSMFIVMQKFAPQTMIFRFSPQMRLKFSIVELFCESSGGLGGWRVNENRGSYQIFFKCIYSNLHAKFIKSSPVILILQLGSTQPRQNTHLPQTIISV